MKDCPSCAMTVAKKSKVCPICNYEFAEDYNKGLKLIALLLIILIILFFIF